MSSQNKNDSFQISEIITDIIDNNNNDNNNNLTEKNNSKNQKASIEQLNERTTLKISSEDIKYKTIPQKKESYDEFGFLDKFKEEEEKK